MVAAGLSEIELRRFSHLISGGRYATVPFLLVINFSLLDISGSARILRSSVVKKCLI